jgi:hypothetical protein
MLNDHRPPASEDKKRKTDPTLSVIEHPTVRNTLLPPPTVAQ